MKPKIVAIVQARIGSSRLPQKVLEDIEGQTMLERVVNRVRESEKLDLVAVATTYKEGDNAIDDICTEHGWSCFRGREDDVLDRYYRSACLFGADIIVRITSDCPLIDPRLIDKVVEKFLSLYPNIDYVSEGLINRMFPRGLDTEVISFEALQSEWQSSTKWREHVTLNLRKNIERYRWAEICSDKNYSNMRWCVDTADDLEFVRKVYRHFGDRMFYWEDVVRLLEEHPDWVIIDWQKDPE